MQYFMDRTLRRIEREANDDLLQVQTLGPQHYSTPELYDLLEQLEEQKGIVSQKFFHVYRIGSLIPVFIIGTFLSTYFEISWLAFMMISCVPLLGIYFTVRSFRIRREHPTYYDSQLIEDKIYQELRRRREESSIF